MSSLTTDAAQDAQPELWEELKVEKTWFHVVRALITRDKIAEMGTTAWAVYCVLKAYTNFQTGETFPSQARIAAHIGASVDTVARATDRLIELGLVEKRRVGRTSRYSLVEQVPLTLEADERAVVAVGEQKYRPLGFQNFLDELERFAKTGVVPKGASFNVTFNVNYIQQGDHGVVNIQQVSVTDEQGRAGSTTMTLQDKLRQLRRIE